MDPRSTATITAGAGISGDADPLRAAAEACDGAAEGLDAPGATDLVFVFASGPRATELARAAEVAARRLTPGLLLACTAEGVVGPSREIERAPGMAVLAVRAPGARLQPFVFEGVRHAGQDLSGALTALRGVIGSGPDLRGVILMADPFTFPAPTLLPIISGFGPGGSGVPVVGGLASVASAAGANVLMINGAMRRDGAIGVAISGDIVVDTVVSQGCRPIGKPMVVTRVEGPNLSELGGRPALQVVSEMIESLSVEERELLRNGLFIGRVVNEYKPRFGRGDFLVRNVAGADEKRGTIAVHDLLRVGQTIQLHVRDATTATEDLELLLDGQRLAGAPAAALAFTCNGRGTRLFNEPHHDARTVSERLSAPESRLPMAGFFAAGEFGPIGGASHLHGHTVTLALLRAGGGA